jgi:hypothetical protein
MTNIQERAWEVFRLFLAVVLGFILLQVGGWLFSTGMIPLTAVRPDRFVKYHYNPAALIVFWASLIGALLWWAIAVFQFEPKFSPKHDRKPARLVWWIIFTISIIIAGASLYIYGKTIPQTIPWMLGSLIIVMVINHWLATAVSTPFLMAHVVPGASWLQRFLRIS